MGTIFNSKLEALNLDTGEDFVKLFEEFNSKNEKKEGTIVSGRITDINNDFVTVDIGIKDEGRIPIKEFIQNNKMQGISVGDTIDVYIESYERNGDVVLSREQAVKENSWEKLEKAMNDKVHVPGVIFGRVKGGLTVDLNGVIAFLPGSQIDVKPVKDISDMLGVEQPFIILKIDKEQGNVVVSRRAIIEESRAEAREETLANIKVGQILEGTVKNLTDYGAFIDLGNIDGLLHVTDIAWFKIAHPSELLSFGQKVKVQVIKYDEATKRVSLGMKQLEPNPWDGIDQRFPVGTKMRGKVTNITDYGVFVELQPGVEGLVHVSELSWTKSNANPRKLVKEGDEVDFVILDIDVEKHRVSLGMKQCTTNVWDTLATKYPIGSVVEGKIDKIVDFGMFVDFGEEIKGLIHASDISWTQDSEKEMRNYKKDDVVKSMILSIDPKRERINLGIKQLTADPFDMTFSKLKKGSVVTCVIKGIEGDGISVTVGESDTYFIKKSDLSNDRVEQRPERFAIGDRVDAKIVDLDRETKKVTLSIKALEKEEQKKKIAEYGSTSSGASLSEILGQAITEVGKKKKPAKEKAVPKTKAKTKKIESTTEPKE